MTDKEDDTDKVSLKMGEPSVLVDNFEKLSLSQTEGKSIYNFIAVTL